MNALPQEAIQVNAVAVDFDPILFREEGLKVDVSFVDEDTGEKWWFCGEVEKVHKVMVRVKFVNGDDSVNLKPVESAIRRCTHNPQLETRFKI